MGSANLGGIVFRLNPTALSLDFSMDTNVQQTVGGRVVQVYGATFGDLTIQGSFGQRRTSKEEHARGALRAAESWELAETFNRQVRALADKQQDLEPHRFTFSYDDGSYTDNRRSGSHSWDLDVYVKSLVDPTSEGVSMVHSTGKFSYDYVLTLFVVRDRSDTLIQAGQDAFIERLSDGVGWSKSAFNGGLSAADLEAFINKHSGNGTIQGALRAEQARRLYAPTGG